MKNVTLTITTAGAAPVTCKLPKGDFLIGRGDGAQIRLRNPAISERHAMIHATPSMVTVEDLGSSNGTFLRDAPLTPDFAAKLSPGDVLAIGPYAIKVDFEEAAPPPDARTAAAEAKAAPPADGGAPSAGAASGPAADALASRPTSSAALREQDSPSSPDPAEEERRRVRREIKNQIHRELVQRLDLKRLSASRTTSAELERRARETLASVIGEVRAKLPKGIDPAKLAEEIYNEALRLGPLEDFLADSTISEIMINGPHKVFVERKGKLELTDQTFMDDASVLAVIERIVSPIGRRIDESQPYVDARLPDGSRVNAIIPPLSLIGPCVTIRKFSKVPLTVEDFIRFGTWTAEMANFLDICVKMRKNIIVSGGTGSGKTTLLNLLSSFIPPAERIVTIEDAAELRLVQPHLVRLEARPPNIEGRGAITIRDLVRNALRMRPDRIIVGECRGGEALDMLQAMNTGHDGSLTTVHANSPRDVVSRLETMVLMSGMELPSRAIREQISSAVDLIVHESRFSDGSRRITHVTEVMGLEGTQAIMQDIFEFRQTGVAPDGRILGHLAPTGSVPSFFEQIKLRGLELDPKIFQPGTAGGGEP